MVLLWDNPVVSSSNSAGVHGVQSNRKIFTYGNSDLSPLTSVPAACSRGAPEIYHFSYFHTANANCTFLIQVS